MNSSQRHESLHARFSDPEATTIGSKWNTNNFTALTPHKPVYLDDRYTDLEHGVAVRLGSQRDGSWLELRKSPEDQTSTFELNIIDSTRRLGNRALIDTVLLVPGDVFTVGRFKYPDVGELVSRNHIQVSILEAKPAIAPLQVAFKDLYSANGSYLYTEKKQDSFFDYDGWYDNEPTDPPYYRNEPPRYEAPPRQEPSQPEQKDIVAEYLVKYGSQYPALSYSDMALCIGVTTHLRSQFADVKDRAKLERALNIALHPDRKAHPNKQVAHELFLLGKNILGL